MKNIKEVFKPLSLIFDDVNCFLKKTNGVPYNNNSVRILRCHIEENLTIITHLCSSSRGLDKIRFNSRFSFDDFPFRKKKCMDTNLKTYIYEGRGYKFSNGYMSREIYLNSYNHEKLFLLFKSFVIDGIRNNYDYEENLAEAYKDDPEGYEEAFEHTFSANRRCVVNADKVEFYGTCEMSTDVNFIKNMNYLSNCALASIILYSNKLRNWFIEIYGEAVIDLVFLYVDDNKKFLLDESNAVGNDKWDYKEVVDIMSSSSDISCILECLVNIFALKAIDDINLRTHFILIPIYYSKIDFLVNKYKAAKRKWWL